MTLEQLLEVASLFLVIGIGIGWLLTRYGPRPPLPPGRAWARGTCTSC